MRASTTLCDPAQASGALGQDDSQGAGEVGVRTCKAGCGMGLARWQVCLLSDRSREFEDDLPAVSKVPVTDACMEQSTERAFLRQVSDPSPQRSKVSSKHCQGRDRMGVQTSPRKGPHLLLDSPREEGCLGQA